MSFLEQIPADRQSAVSDALAQTFAGKPVEGTLLQGGLSGAAVYKIEADTQAYILKIDTPGISYECIQAAALAGITPEVLYADSATGISISKFVASQNLRMAFASPTAMVQALAQTIRRLHAVPAFSKTGDMPAMITGLIAQFKASALLSGPAYDEVFAHYARMPWTSDTLVASHNDLNPSNILYDGEKIWLIDWDAAFTNDRYVDLAVTANMFAPTPDLENALLQAYFDNPGEYESARLFLMRQRCYLVYALLMFQLSAAAIPALLVEHPALPQTTMREVGEMMRSGQLNVGTPLGRLYYGHGMLNEALRNMQSPRFEAAIKTVTI